MQAALYSRWAREKQQARLREQKRDHMRRWRLTPANRAHERERQRLSELERKLKLATHDTGWRRCGFCYQRASVRKVERLIATTRGFRRIFVPYCGVC